MTNGQPTRSTASPPSRRSGPGSEQSDLLAQLHPVLPARHRRRRSRGSCRRRSLRRRAQPLEARLRATGRPGEGGPRQSRYGHVGMAIAAHRGDDRHGRRAVPRGLRPTRAQPARARHPPHDPPDDPGRLATSSGRVRAVSDDGGQIEAWTLVEIDRCDAVTCQAIESELASVLADVDQAVSDWAEMARRALALADELEAPRQRRSADHR